MPADKLSDLNDYLARLDNAVAASVGTTDGEILELLREGMHLMLTTLGYTVTVEESVEQ